MQDLKTYFDLKTACKKDVMSRSFAEPIIWGHKNRTKAFLIENDGHFRSLLNGFLKHKTSVNDITKK
jgi:hypothetical protein